MQDKKCCRSNLRGFAVRVKGQEIPYSVCDVCSGIWLDKDESVHLRSEYRESNNNVISDYSCPRCPDNFLESLKVHRNAGLLIYQCRKCQGTRIDHFHPEKIRNESLRVKSA